MKKCDYDRLGEYPFCYGRSLIYPSICPKYMVDLLRGMTLQDVANHLNISWNTVKEIHSTYLLRHYCPPSLKGVKNMRY